MLVGDGLVVAEAREVVRVVGGNRLREADAAATQLFSSSALQRVSE